MTRIQRPTLKQTGKIWKLSAARRSGLVEHVCSTLKDEYGAPRLGNPSAPLDDFIFIVLSNKTSPSVAARTYEGIRSAFPSWNAVLDSSPRMLRALLKPAGLSRVKASQIRRALKTIHHDFGSCDLSPLREMPVPRAEAYLATLPGASLKVAKCVVMYTLGAKVLPVDAHVHRIASRLGWTSRKRADQCHEELEVIVPPQLRHAFHVDCILHGRSICLARTPKCAACCIRRYCAYYKATRSA